MKLFIRGAQYTQELKKMFLTQTENTVTISNAIRSFAEEYNNLNSTTVKVDKMVIYVDKTTNYVNEFNTLEKLLVVKEPNGTKHKSPYFQAREIYLFVNGTYDDSKVINEFNSRFENLDFVFTKAVVQQKKEYSEIYDVVIKTKTGKQSKNSYKIRIAVDPNHKSLKSVDPMVYNADIEPFNLNRVNTYNETKLKVIAAGIKDTIQEDESKNSGIVSKDTGELKRLREASKYSTEAYIDIVSGTPNTGTTLLGTSLVATLLRNRNKVLYIDYSRTKDFVTCLKYVSFKNNSYKIITSMDLILGNQSGLPNYQLLALDPTDIQPEVLLSYILTNITLIGVRNIVIDCELSDITNILENINSKVNKINITSTKDYGEVKYIAKCLANVENSFINILLSDKETDMSLIQDLTVYKVKELLKNYNFIDMPRLEAFKPEPELILKVMGKENN